MKIVLETIPVWDAFRASDECPVCTLMEKAEKDALSYYLSSAIMTPEVRVETNENGFCPYHFILLSKEGKPQSLALLMDTYYGKDQEIFSPYFTSIKKAGNARKALKAAEGFRSALSEREKGCLICSRMKEREDRYLYTIASLWNDDSAFRSFFNSSKGLCMHHTALLSENRGEPLSGPSLLSFLQDLFSLLERNLERVRKDDWWMTQKYKSENKDKPWNGAEDAHKRAVEKVVGKARVLDPVKGKKSRI